jgi:hypothetical protein
MCASQTAKREVLLTCMHCTRHQPFPPCDLQQGIAHPGPQAQLSKNAWGQGAMSDETMKCGKYTKHEPLFFKIWDQKS